MLKNKNNNNPSHLKYYKFKINSKTKSAFSLIELSIVLIIIGLLVAGVTGGASLITSAKNRALINEITGLKQAVLAFKAARGRYPGDIYNIGRFGMTSGYGVPPYTYSKTDFAPPFDTGSFTPAAVSAPFVEFYTEKIIDFKPTTAHNACTAYPCSKVYQKIGLYYYYNISTSTNPIYYLYNFRANIVSLAITHYVDYTTDPRVAKTLDTKIDDGLYNSGNLRFYCYKKVGGVDSDGGLTSYDDSINTKSVCLGGYYDLRLE